MKEACTICRKQQPNLLIGWGHKMCSSECVQKAKAGYVPDNSGGNDPTFKYGKTKT
jgi:hypothetical protein